MTPNRVNKNRQRRCETFKYDKRRLIARLLDTTKRAGGGGDSVRELLYDVTVYNEKNPNSRLSLGRYRSITSLSRYGSDLQTTPTIIEILCEDLFRGEGLHFNVAPIFSGIRKERGRSRVQGGNRTSEESGGYASFYYRIKGV